MKTLKHAAIAALLSCSLLTPVTPAVATTFPVTSVPTQLDADAKCAATNTVDATHSVITSALSSAIVGASSEVAGSRTTDESTRRADLSSAYTLDPATFISGTEHRHGGSPNIFGEFNIGGITYSRSFVTQNWATTRTDTYAFTCTPYTYQKIGEEVVTDPTAGDFPGLGECTGNPGSDNGKGQEQSSINSRCKRGTETVIDIYDWVAGTPVNHEFALAVSGTDSAEVNQAVPFHVAGPFQEDRVICISPAGDPTKKNPGTWRQQNGYTGVCSTDVFYALDGRAEPIPSNSLPPR